MNKLDPNIGLMDYPHGVRSDKWKNIYFRKDGTTLIGENIHESEEDCRDTANFFSTPQRDGAKGALSPDGKILLYAEFSHHIQMPVKP